MNATHAFYDEHAARVAAGYERVDFESINRRVLRYLGPDDRLLEIGSGSGRDAAWFLALGLDVRCLDASEAMIDQAVAHHPELSGRIGRHALPAPLPFADASFDAVTAMAVIMHLAEDELTAAFDECARVCRAGGTFAYSVNTERAGLDADGRDEKGRHFTCMTKREWEGLHAAAGFSTAESWESEDITERPGIRWVTFICKREASP